MPHTFWRANFRRLQSDAHWEIGHFGIILIQITTGMMAGVERTDLIVMEFFRLLDILEPRMFQKAPGKAAFHPLALIADQAHDHSNSPSTA